jgi:cytosine/adenosine deaminase-related metal-dependent hydrolase
VVAKALEFIAGRGNVLGGFGLAPHAPYTAGAELYRLAAHRARARNMPLTTHLAESQEEDDMFRRGSGHMYDYFRRAGRDMGDCKRVGVCQLMFERGVLGPHCLAAHANWLTPLDVKLLSDSRTNVVHCPNSHRFFGRGTPMLKALLANRVNVCLGTDSMASNDQLDMFGEMRRLAHVFPELPAEHIVEMATVCGARALNLSHKLGRIARGALADLIAVPLEDGAADPYESVVYAEKPITFSMVNGKAVVA